MVIEALLFTLSPADPATSGAIPETAYHIVASLYVFARRDMKTEDNYFRGFPALWNIVATVDAFLSAGFTPAELMRWVHPSLVANTQGTGMGGMSSMHSLYINTLLGENNPNDILQEALPNVIAAHVVQSYVGSYGAMIHPVAACATTAVSVEEGVDKIRLGKAELVHDELLEIDDVMARIDAVTLDEVRAVAEVFSRPEILAVVGPA